MEKLLISNSPHFRKPLTTKRIMIEVLIALLPATIMGIVFFGFKALLVIALTVLSCVASELCYKLIMLKGLKFSERFKNFLKDFDFTSLVTGLLLALNLPSTVDWYLPIIGGAFAIIVVKMIFGGTGKNFVNPAIAGRIMLIMSFPAIMTKGWVATEIGTLSGKAVETGSTVLGTILSGDFGSVVHSNLDLFLGTGLAGCIGETCKLALLIGGLYLFFRRIIDWKPLIYIAVVGLWTVAIKGFNFEYFLPSILSGGLFLGAIFMATDYVTSPNTEIGSYIYFILLGVLTAWLRVRTGAEVVSYVILLMNICVPLIDRLVVPKPFGYQKPPKQKNKEKEAK